MSISTCVPKSVTSNFQALFLVIIVNFDTSAPKSCYFQALVPVINVNFHTCVLKSCSIQMIVPVINANFHMYPIKLLLPIEVVPTNSKLPTEQKLFHPNHCLCHKCHFRHLYPKSCSFQIMPQSLISVSTLVPLKFVISNFQTINVNVINVNFHTCP